MAGTIRARTGNGDVVFNIRTGKVCKADYAGAHLIDRLDVEATCKNLGATPEQLRKTGCELVHCTFYLVTGTRRPGTPYPYATYPRGDDDEN